jgi:hypothetical protein
VKPLPGVTLIGPLAYRGKVGCLNVTCTRRSLEFGPEVACYGWHCSYCDAPCSSMGHGCDAANAVLGEARRIMAEDAG